MIRTTLKKPPLQKPTLAAGGRRRLSALELVLLTVLAGFAVGAVYKLATPSDEVPTRAGPADKGAVDAARAHRMDGQPRELRGGAPGAAQDSGADPDAAADPEARAEQRPGHADANGDEDDESLDPIGMKRKDGLAWRKGAAADPAAGTGKVVRAEAAPAAGPPPALQKLRLASQRGEAAPALSHSEVAALAEPDVREALKLLETMPWGPDTSRMFQNVIGRWGEVNPAAAMDYAMSLESLRTRNSAVSSVLDTWSRADPQAAYAWFNKQLQANPASVYGAARNLFGNMARQDQGWALAQAAALQDPGIKRTALQTIYDRMAREGQGDDLVAMHGGMPAGTDRNMLSEAIVSMWTPYEPERAAQWAMALEDAQTRQKSLDRVLSSWTSDQPSKAAEFALSLPEGDARSKSLGRVMDTWARGDLERAADWLARYPPSTQMDPAMQSLAQAMIPRDPAAAVSWASNITEPKAREKTVARAAWQWMQVAPEQARAAIPGLGLSPQMQQKMLGVPAAPAAK